MPVPEGTVAGGMGVIGAIGGAIGMVPGGAEGSDDGGVPARADARLLAFRSSVVGDPVDASWWWRSLW
ncbi:hypothetical protein AA12717_3893 [Gluconacetobacter sacchari DSM 12717]|uniref:Uncharacterized protein n=1 Tax=Gluconacetobacter sacchari DSM 12717 TaxID=1307940 RepID=A0ABQ0PCM3_9PROT|nr:hypothetical protein AA12717_3893 [Gluconacetobacter sacchari DSM 12717]